MCFFQRESQHEDSFAHLCFGLRRVDFCRENYLAVEFAPRTFFQKMFFAVVFFSVRRTEIFAVGPVALAFYHDDISVTFYSHGIIMYARARYLRINNDSSRRLENVDFKLLRRNTCLWRFILCSYLILFFVVRCTLNDIFLFETV